MLGLGSKGTTSDRGFVARRAKLVRRSVVAVFTICGACGFLRRPPGYRATIPHQAATNRIQAKITTVNAVGGLAGLKEEVFVAVEISAPSGTLLRSVRLARSASAPCQAGLTPRSIRIDRRRAEPNVEPGRFTELWLYFDRASVESRRLLERGATVLDLRLSPVRTDTATCLRVPVAHSTARVEWEMNPSWFVGMGFSALVPLASGDGIGGGVLVQFRGGRWLGWLRLQVDFGAGRAAAKDEVPNARQHFDLFQAAVSFNTVPLWIGRLGVGFALGYETVALSRHTIWPGENESDEFVGLRHGPRAALRLVRALFRPLRGPAFKARKDLFSVPIEIFVSRWGGSTAPTTVLGVSITIDIGLAL